MPKFLIPSSLDEADTLRLQLVEQIQEIQIQLGDRNRAHPITGVRMCNSDYWTWRTSAQAALRHKLSCLRDLKGWIKGQNQQRHQSRITSIGLDVNDPASLIERSYELLVQLLRDGVDFDENELVLIDALREYRKRQAVPLRAVE